VSSASLASQVGALTTRGLTRTLRQPAIWIPPLVFPTALMLVNSGGLESATHLPGFPSDSFLAFALAVPFVQGALFATMNAGSELARDVQIGFLNRLQLTPMRGSALLAGQLGAIVLFGLVQAAFYVLVGIVAGVHLEAGPAGILVLFALMVVVSLGFGAFGAGLALRTGSGEAVQGMFPLLFVFLFISSMNMPRNLIETDWFRVFATLNPVSYLIEAVRSLIVVGWDAQALALGFGISGAIAAGSLVFASVSLRKRMTRT
jgi:ABC-2 type transport system permease protein